MQERVSRMLQNVMLLTRYEGLDSAMNWSFSGYVSAVGICVFVITCVRNNSVLYKIFLNIFLFH
jgi:hypothetical protein